MWNTKEIIKKLQEYMQRQKHQSSFGEWVFLNMCIDSKCFSLINLALITGHLGKPGTGLHPLRGQNNVQGASDAGLIPMSYPDYNSVKIKTNNKKCKILEFKFRPNDGKTVVEIIKDIEAGVIKGLYVLGENPAMSDPDLIHTRKGLAKLDHLVVQDIFMTETAWFADVILPATAHAEKLGTYTNTNDKYK